MKGYGGRILFVDATSGSSRVEPVSEERARSLLGGNGFAARLLLDHVPSGTDAYDPALRALLREAGHPNGFDAGDFARALLT